MFSLRPYMPPDFSQECFTDAPEAVFLSAPADGVAPENYHAMSIFPEYVKRKGKWLLPRESRMDCVAVLEGEELVIREFRKIRRGDRILVGRGEKCEEGIYMHTEGFQARNQEEEAFSFRRNRSRETAQTRDYQELVGLLMHERDHGKAVWVMGPAFTFDHDAREAMSWLIRNGFVHSVLAGNALATHDLEAAWLGTALGQDIHTHVSRAHGHYNHLDTLNRVRKWGSVPAFIRGEGIDNGIIYSCEACHVPYVLAGSIRDDGPLPCVFGDVYEAQDRMRDALRGATTVICMATALHTIATGNMTPSYRVMKDGSIRQVFFYSVDVSEFAVNKLADRGSLGARGIVTNAQDFVVRLRQNLSREIAGSDTAQRKEKS